MQDTLQDAREQLRYWQAELAAAIRASNAERIAECERVIGQFERLIAALETTLRHKPRQPRVMTTGWRPQAGFLT